MATPSKTITTREFSDLTGVPPATIATLIREGKLKARKTGGKWAIPRSQLSAQWLKSRTQSPQTPYEPPPSHPRVEMPPSSDPAPPSPAAADSGTAEATYSIPEFSAMSYLTEKGVAEWLKIGRLKGVKSESGEWRVLGRNLQLSDIRRLLRK